MPQNEKALTTKKAEYLRMKIFYLKKGAANETQILFSEPGFIVSLLFINKDSCKATEAN